MEVADDLVQPPKNEGPEEREEQVVPILACTAVLENPWIPFNTIVKTRASKPRYFTPLASIRKLADLKITDRVLVIFCKRYQSLYFAHFLQTPKNSQSIHPFDYLAIIIFKTYETYSLLK